MHHRDVVLATLDAGLVDADQAHVAHVVLGARHADVMRDAPPQPLAAHAQQVGGLGNGKLMAQGQRERLEQQGEAAARAGPKHFDQIGLGAGGAFDAGQLGVQPSFVLEEVEVAPCVQSAVRNQIELRASDLDVTLPVDHQARAVWAFVASLDLRALYARIKAVEGSRYSALGVPPSTRPS